MPIQLEDIGKALQAQYAVRGPIVPRAQDWRRGAGDHLLQHRQPAGAGAAAAHVRPAAARPQRVPGPRRRRPRTLFPPTSSRAPGAAVGTRHGRLYAEPRHAVHPPGGGRVHPQRDGIAASPRGSILTDGASKGVQTVCALISGAAGRHPDPDPAVPALQRQHHALRRAEDRLLPRRGPRVEAQRDDARREPRARAAATGSTVSASASSTPATPPARCSPARTSRWSSFRPGPRARDDRGRGLPGERVPPGVRLRLVRQGDPGPGGDGRHLFSLHSVSKGFLGECGHRGGYLEVRNVPDDVLARSSSSSRIASAPTSGPGRHLLHGAPPQPGEPSTRSTRRSATGSRRAEAGARCSGRRPQPDPRHPVQRVAGRCTRSRASRCRPAATDEEYCMALLEKTGICVVPGSGFGQVAGTGALPHDDPAAHAPDREGRGPVGEVPRELPIEVVARLFLFPPLRLLLHALPCPGARGAGRGPPADGRGRLSHRRSPILGTGISANGASFRSKARRCSSACSARRGRTTAVQLHVDPLARRALLRP